MRYFKLVTFTSGGDYETRETLIDESKFRQYQKALMEGAELLILEDRVIKRNMIKEILPADDEVKEYLAMGVSLSRLGLPEAPKLETRNQERLSPKMQQLEARKSELFKSNLTPKPK